MFENRDNKPTKKDIIFVTVYFVFIVADIILYIIANHQISIGYIVSGIIERIILITLSFVGLIGIGHSSGWSILVPDFFEANLHKKRKEEIREFIKAFFENDINFLNDYSEERIQFIMTQLGITGKQLDKLRLELINMRCIPIKNIENAKEKIESIIKCDYPIVINQDNIDSSKLCYDKVKYFINFNDLTFLPVYAKELAQILSFLIKEKCILADIDKIVIPHDSNFLLGIEVGKRIGKPVIKIRFANGRIETEKRWDGALNPSDKVIIIHDVLVTSEQIDHTLRTLPSTCEVLALFCLIARTEWNGLEKLKENNITVHRVVDLNDKIISEIRCEA